MSSISICIFLYTYMARRTVRLENAPFCMVSNCKQSIKALKVAQHLNFKFVYIWHFVFVAVTHTSNRVGAYTFSPVDRSRGSPADAIVSLCNGSFKVWGTRVNASPSQRHSNSFYANINCAYWLEIYIIRLLLLLSGITRTIFTSKVWQ